MMCKSDSYPLESAFGLEMLSSSRGQHRGAGKEVAGAQHTCASDCYTEYNMSALEML